MILTAIFTSSILLSPGNRISHAGLALLSPLDWTIGIIALATPIAFLCGILLKVRTIMTHLGAPDMVRQDLTILVIWSATGVFAAFPAGWIIARMLVQ